MNKSTIDWKPGMSAWDPNNERCIVLEVHDSNPDAGRYLFADTVGPWLTVRWADGIVRTMNSRVFADRPDNTKSHHE